MIAIGGWYKAPVPRTPRSPAGYSGPHPPLRSAPAGSRARRGRSSRRPTRARHLDGGRHGAADEATARAVLVWEESRQLLPARRAAGNVDARDPRPDATRQPLRHALRARRPDVSATSARHAALERRGQADGAGRLRRRRGRDAGDRSSSWSSGSSRARAQASAKGDFARLAALQRRRRVGGHARSPLRCSPSASSRSSPTRRRAELPAGLPLYISGGCGLNCDWNMHMARARATSRRCSSRRARTTPARRSARRSTPCTRSPATRTSNGTSTAASSSSGTREPDSGRVAAAAARRRRAGRGARRRHVVAWVQGRWEIGPARARQPLAPGGAVQRGTRDRLNEIKQREDYRPIAPCCRLEDAGDAVRPRLRGPVHALFPSRHGGRRSGAVTHVDGSARVPDGHRGRATRGSTSC